MPLEGAPTLSDAPQLAPGDYHTLAPVVRGKPDGGHTLTVGSGVIFFKHPELPGDVSDRCAGCGSTDTLCIAVDVTADLVGRSGNYELVCNECGKFSQYSFWR